MQFFSLFFKDSIGRTFHVYKREKIRRISLEEYKAGLWKKKNAELQGKIKAIEHAQVPSSAPCLW